MRLQLPADTAQLARLGTFVRAACSRLPQPGLPEVAVTELAANAIRHGGASRLQVQVTEQHGAYLLLFEDDGAAFDPTRAPSLPAGELREGGYGLVIVRRSTRLVEYRRRDPWNQVALRYLTGVPL
jgi:anti-sigma regulatory factor (Ser/Thr protein kinase)